jgi:hypothetical protein
VITVMRRLDRSLLSEEAIEFLSSVAGGGSADLVDNDRPRDYVWTDEIIAATETFVLASPDGEVLSRDFGTIGEAEKARDGARLTVQFELDDDPPPVAVLPATEDEAVGVRLGSTGKGTITPGS